MILFINNGWWYAALSGGDLHVLEVASRWARRLNVGIAMPKWAYRNQEARLANVALVGTGLVENRPPRGLGGAYVRYLFRSASRLRAKPDVVVAASHYPYDLIPAWTISRRTGAPLVVYLFHLASMFRKGGLRAAGVRAWENTAVRMLRDATLVLADNDGVVHELVRRGIRRDRIARTWNASTDQPDDIAEVRTTNEIVFCHAISDTKGWQDLAIIGDRLRHSAPGAVLRVLGDGPRRKALEHLIEEARLSDVVRIEGYVDEETKWRALLRAAVFVAPSREEGWGIAVGEALEAGAPVVCYDLPVFREVHGEDRLHLVPVGYPEQFAGAVVDLLNAARAEVAPNRTPKAVLSVPRTALITWDQIAQSELDLVSELRDGGGRRVLERAIARPATPAEVEVEAPAEPVRVEAELPKTE